jgi:hypothetical protein
MSSLESGDTSVSQLVDTYKQIRPSLHVNLFSDKIDIGALTYCLTRLPRCFFYVETLLLAQHLSDFQNKDLDILSWQNRIAPDRRRQVFYNPNTKTAITFLSSDSDIDDIINILICFHIEWSKIGKILTDNGKGIIDFEKYSLFGLNQTEWQRLKTVLGKNWKNHLQSSTEIKNIVIKLISHSDEKYQQTISAWWTNVSQKSFYLDFSNLPIYFISSNQHSLVNIIGRYVTQKENDIFYFIHKKHPDLEKEWQSVKNGSNLVRITDFLYYISGKYFQSYPDEQLKKIQYEESLGIKKIQSINELICNVQIFPVSIFSKLPVVDPSLSLINIDKISKSDALIVNTDYPLGFAAYYVFREILLKQKNIRGLYSIGKAAILSGEIGDIQVPSSIFDERTGNIFKINNCFNHENPIISKQNQVFLNQRAICVYNPFLENEKQLKGYIDTGFNIVEMESGPLMTSIAQWQSRRDTPQNVVFNIGKLPFDYGIINYASDNPLSRTLGEGSMAIRGVEPTYLATISVLQRIIDLECI